ncbi:MAG: hypothetical protein DMF83_22935 [Acidobacteria bacterium]|nr:MAG: hypothetical protein DMF83_22935 [Acidobacteriota bacterium]
MHAMRRALSFPAVRLSWRRGLSLALAAGLMSLLVGDRARAITTNPGIDPLQILDLQIKPNVYIILDTSGSMREPFQNAPQMGGDDPMTKMYRAKSALNSFLTTNATKYNFGFGSYNLLNSQKVLSYDDNLFNATPLGGHQDLDGPILYVTADNPTTTSSNFWRTWFVNQINDLNTGYLITPALGAVPPALTNAQSANVYRSYEDFANNSAGGTAFNIDGSNCTVEPCRRYLNSRLLRDGLRFKWDTTQTINKQNYLLSVTSIVGGCPLPPVGLFPQDPNVTGPAGTTDLKRPCLQMETAGVPGQVSTWFYTAARWQRRDGLGSTSQSGCDGGATLENVAGCANDNTGVIKTFLRPELPVDGSCAGTPAGFPCGVPVALSGVLATTSPAIASTNPATTAGLNPDTQLGISAAQYTPLGKSLDQVNTNRATIFPVQPGLPPGVTQPNVVILITDGLDTCGGVNATTAAATLRANGILTFVIGLAVPGSMATLNAISQAGSSTDAFAVTDEVALENSLVTILTGLPVAGTFSDQQSITESVYELVALATASPAPSPAPSPALDPLDPQARYNATVPVLLQSIFEMPGYNGHLRAFRNVGGASTLMWDAGDLLCQRVTGYKASLDAAGLPVAPCNIGGTLSPAGGGIGTSTTRTFAQLTGGATAANVSTSAALVKRRIYTSTQNGVNTNYTAQNLVNGTSTTSPATWGQQAALWPPDAAVDPAVSGNTYPAGSLDTALGIASLTFAQLQTQFGACRKSTDAGSGTLPGDCTVTSGSPPRQEQIARKEAREMILAFTAGADVVRGSDTLPMRDAAGNIRHKARTWIMAESSLAAPGVITPPLQSNVSTHLTPEYVLYRDGPRDTSVNPKLARNLIYSGFGLRNPDDDNQSASRSDTTLKPSMSLVLQPTNHMLHAFRAGPQSTSAGTCTTTSTNDCGGEELWAFVPFDQLSKLLSRMQPQTRANHTYVMAAPVRFADVFLPGSFSKSFTGGTASGSGVWRTVVVMGRGAGGKSLTALDVTVPGPFTLQSLQTRPPVIVWNRGNADTSDGNCKSGTAGCTAAANSYNNNAADYAAFAKMGETWSVPSIGFATAANNVTNRKPSGVEFVAWVGSGYSDVSTEGTTFFALDALTGDVIGSSSQAAFTLAAGTSAAAIPNALPASTSGFAARPLSFNDPSAPTLAHPATEKVTAVYFPDLHSRVWKFNPDAPTTAPTLFKDFSGDNDQPMANGVSLINMNSDNTTNKAHLFFEAGNDRRVPLRSSAPLFRMYGYRDDGSASQVFAPVDFPQGFRGTVQPATAFNANGKGRVFFAGTRFNPVTATICASSFDSVLFALEAATGGAAYDLNTSGDDRFVTLTNQRVNAVQVVAGKLVVDMGLGAQNPPPPPAPPQTAPPAPGPNANISVVSNVPGTIPFKLGSSVCR